LEKGFYGVFLLHLNGKKALNRAGARWDIILVGERG
jgi:hypothetical protein